MDVRDAMNRFPKLTAVVVSVCGIVTIIFVLRGRASLGPSIASEAYFSDDQGQTYFSDNADRLPPFDHSGKQAVRAYVFQCGDGKPFVGYLERFSETTKAKVSQLREKPLENADAIRNVMDSGLEVSKPSTIKWVNRLSTAGVTVTQMKCPDGGQLMGVVP